MATKKKTPAEKPVKKKTYKKPTADKMADNDLAGVTGGESDGRRPKLDWCKCGDGTTFCSNYGNNAIIGQ